MIFIRLPVLVLLIVGLLGCDPVHNRRFSVYSDNAQATLQDVLTEFDRTTVGSMLHRITPPQKAAANYRENGYDVVRWYDRDPDPTDERGSFYFLVVLQEKTSQAVELESVAFPSMSEPNELMSLRRLLSQELCSAGFIVEGECDQAI